MLVLLLLLVATSSPAPATGDEEAVAVINDFSRSCNSTSDQQFYLPNSTFAANLVNMSAVLPKNSSASGFSAGAFGRAPDTAYGLALCRGDLTGDACATCLTTAFRNAVSRCGYSKDVTIFHDQCHIRFYDRDFLAGTANSPEKFASNMNNVSRGNVAAFDGLVTGLANAVADRASNVSGRYATGQAGFPPDKITVYGQAQCTPDLTTAQCRACLAGMIKQMPKFFSGRVGGRILGVRCAFRYEKDIFFATTGDMVTLTPLLDPSKAHPPFCQGLSRFEGTPSIQVFTKVWFIWCLHIPVLITTVDRPHRLVAAPATLLFYSVMVMVSAHVGPHPVYDSDVEVVEPEIPTDYAIMLEKLTQAEKEIDHLKEKLKRTEDEKMGLELHVADIVDDHKNKMAGMRLKLRKIRKYAIDKEAWYHYAVGSIVTLVAIMIVFVVAFKFFR